MVFRCFSTFSAVSRGVWEEICYREEAPQHAYNSWGAPQDTKREWAPYLAGYRGMGEAGFRACAGRFASEFPLKTGQK